MASKEHNYCFWRYVNDESLPNGRMPELNQKEVGELLGLCPTTVHFTVKAGKEKLKESELANIVEEYYEDCGGTPSGGVNLDSLLPNTNLFSDE